MKQQSSFKILASVVACMGLLLSCERKVDTEFVKIHLQLPARGLSQDYLRSITDPLSANSISILTTNAGNDEGAIKDIKNLFNSTLPSMASGSTVPLNCYLLVVSGPASEPDFSKNYCAKKSNPSENLLVDATSPKLEFGPYVGLIDVYNYNNTIEMELSSGEDRKFTLLGFNSQVACSDIFSALKNKSKLSKAYRIGASQPHKLTSGTTTEIVINLLSEVDEEDYFSDCVIPDPETAYPIYEGADLIKYGFPYGVFRTFPAAPGANDFLCESIDINLKGRDPYTALAVPGTVDQPTDFKLFIGANVLLPTYDTEQACSADTGAVTTAQNQFTINKNQISQKRWFKQTRVGTANITVVLKKADNTPVRTVAFGQNVLTSLFLDTIVPVRMQAGVCYQAVQYLRDINGNLVINTNNITLNNNDMNGTSFAINMFSTLADCENNAVAGSLTFASGTNSFAFYIKGLDAGASAFEFALGITDPGARGIVNSKAPVRVTASTITTANPNIFSSVRFTGKNVIPNNPAPAGGALDCMPVFLSLARDNISEFILSSSGTLTLADIKVQVADETGPNTVGYGLYSEGTCTTSVFPIGSTALASGTAISNPGVSSSFYKFYIKPDHLANYGSRKLMFYYQSILIGFFQFDLTDPNH